jgi:hypothetical protein
MRATTSLRTMEREQQPQGSTRLYMDSQVVSRAGRTIAVMQLVIGHGHVICVCLAGSVRAE